MAQAPTWSASVETLRSMPSRHSARLAVERLVLPELSNRIMASRFGREAARRHMEGPAAA